MAVFLSVLHTVITVFSWLVIIHVILAYFMSPYHPVRQTIDKLVNPLLEPIRRILPRTGMIDFSPLVLIVLLQLLEMILTQIIRSY
jgi:YggT family protein